MAKVTLENIAQHLQILDKRFDSVDSQLVTVHTHLDVIYTKLKTMDAKLDDHEDLLNIIADRVSHHDDDLTTIKKSLQPQRA